MNFNKGIDGQVNKVIDQAADVAKEKIGGMIGGDQKKGKEKAGGICDKLGSAVGKGAANQAVDQATEQALSTGKKLFG